jgi:uncharacterized protein
LVRDGFSLSPRDYQDALIAMQLGYGSLDRERLLWLCDALWARTDEESVLLRRLFGELPRPTAKIVAALTRRKQDVERPGSEPDQTEDAPSQTQSAAAAEDRAAARSIQFGTPEEIGIGLPRAMVPESAYDPFIFTPRPPVNLRTLVVTWRRFRLAKRTGPKVELDIEATVAEQSRHGLLVEPALVPARRNQARLLVVVDASPSMAPWRGLSRSISESLTRGQLGHAALYYFNNVPAPDLFESERLIRPVEVSDAMRRHPDCPLLVVSDAGAARGTLDPVRVSDTRRFVAEATGGSWRPVAWVNPMPRRRWRGTSAQRIAELRGGSAMFELSDDGLVQAVDFLRGKRAA